MTDQPTEPTGAVFLCQACGQPMPPLPDELAKLARTQAGISLAHDVCPGTAPKVEGRYFEVRVSIVEITDVTTEHPFSLEEVVKTSSVELAAFKTGLRANDLDAAMRPLAAALGEKWMAVEKQAKIADAQAADFATTPAEQLR